MLTYYAPKQAQLYAVSEILQVTNAIESHLNYTKNTTLLIQLPHHRASLDPQVQFQKRS
jgi:hypothetical protein